MISRISSPRCAVCFGGSNVGSWSLNGSPSRYCSMMSLMSSPSSGTGHSRERSGDRVALEKRRVVVVDRHRFLVPGDHDHTVMRLAPHRAVRAEVLVVGVRVLPEVLGAEEVDLVEVGTAHPCSNPISATEESALDDLRGRVDLGRRSRPRAEHAEQRDHDDGLDVDVAEAARPQVRAPCAAGPSRAVARTRPGAPGSWSAASTQTRSIAASFTCAAW